MCFVSEASLTCCNSISGYLTFRLSAMDSKCERNCYCEALFTLFGVELGYVPLAVFSLVVTAVRLPLLLPAPLGAFMVCFCAEINWDDVVVLTISVVISLLNAVRCLFAVTTNVFVSGRDYPHLAF